jgi:RNA recognition motif-containing protein
MINYIPTTIDEMQLRQLFEQYGPIESVKIVCDRETRQSRGYGFVKYRQSASAQMAIEALNGYPIMNKRLKVALASAGLQKRNMGMNPYAANMTNAQLQMQQMMAMQYQQYMMAQQQAMMMQQQRFH